MKTARLDTSGDRRSVYAAPDVGRAVVMVMRAKPLPCGTSSKIVLETGAVSCTAVNQQGRRRRKAKSALLRRSAGDGKIGDARDMLSDIESNCVLISSWLF